MPDVYSSSFVSPSTLGLDDVANRDFPTVRRGFDQGAVQRFLQLIATQIRELKKSEQDLKNRLSDAERRAEVPELDEDVLSLAVGTETGKVLQAAHEAARSVLANAEARAEHLVHDAEATVAERSHAASAEASAMIARARADAEAAIEAAKYQSQMMIDEAREARRRILSDLADRRRALHVQLEQLRAGRDALAGIVGVVASSVEAVRTRLDHAEQEARSAADDAGRAHQLSAVETSIEEVVAEALSDLAPHLEPTSVEHESTEPGRSAGEGGHEEFEEKSDVLDELDSRSVDASATVDALFARIRATRAERGVPSAEELVTTDGSEEQSQSVEDTTLVPVMTDDVSGSLETVAARSREASAEPAEPFETVVPGQGERSDATLDELKALEEAEPIRLEISAEEQLIARRDALLRPSASELGRVLKRLLRIEQNDLLDALRHVSSSEDPLARFPFEAVAMRTVEAVGPALRDAWKAGELFAQELSGQQTDQVDGPAEHKAISAGVEEVATELGNELVSALRRHLEGAADSFRGEGDLPGYVNVGFRDLKGTRIEGIAGDFAMRAFSRGSLNRASAINTLLRWVVDDDGASCPDCDDNALAGPQQAGGAFPTGHAYSPVHPGCRCILVPAP